MNKKIKRCMKVISLALVFAVCFSMVAFAASVSDFSDVSSSAWYYDELAYATENGLIKGTSSTTFSPDSTMSRGQFITIIGRMFGEEVTPGFTFSDVGNTKWYAGYVYWGVDKGIIKGTSSSTFEPDADISRQDMATIIGRILETFNYVLDDADDAVASFADANTISSYAAGYCETLRRTGLLKGGTDGNLDPKRSMTRAEGMVVLVRLAKAIDNVGTGSCSHNYVVDYYTQTANEINGYLEKYYVKCSKCGNEEYRETQVEFSDEWSYDEQYHYHEALNYDDFLAKDYTLHDFEIAWVIVEVASAANNWMYTAINHCSTCDYYRTEQYPKT